MDNQYTQVQEAQAIVVAVDVLMEMSERIQQEAAEANAIAALTELAERIQWEARAAEYMQTLAIVQLEMNGLGALQYAYWCAYMADQVRREHWHL